MPLLIVRALAWFGPIAIGWFASDVYNEANSTNQLNAAGLAGAAKKTIFQKWWFYYLFSESY
jgi:hypothetical protein